MDFSGIRVLVTEASGKQSLAIVHGLKEIGCHVTVVCSSKKATCFVSNKPDKKILCRYISDHDERAFKALKKLVRSENYDVLMPIGEMGTNFVTEHEDELKQYVRLACAPREAYLKAFNKQQTFEIASRNNIPVPKTRMSDQTIEEYLSTVEFPLIIKPRNGMGSVGFHKFESRDDFDQYIREHDIDLDSYVLQEYVDYEKRLGAVLLMDREGNVCMSYADEILRWFPIDAGTACMVRIIDHPELLSWAGNLLRAMKWQGVAALSFMVDRKTNVPKLLEINGRIPQSIRLGSLCGYNVPKLLIELAYGGEVEQYTENKGIGKCIRHLDMELAWFIKSPDRFKAKPSWFSWRRTSEVLFYRDDIKPFFVHFFNQLRQYKSIMKKKQH